jgi:hypothetical protein
MLSNVIREAGWPVYFVIAFGAAALVSALRHAAAPERGQLGSIIGFGAVTLLWGALGTALGLQHAISGIPDVEPDQRWIVWVGLREALNNFSLALFIDVAVALLATVGARRLGRQERAASA